MKVRIIHEPKGSVDGMSLRYYREGLVYDVSPHLAEYLVAEGCALIEMRERQRSTRIRSNDRRRPPSSR